MAAVGKLVIYYFSGTGNARQVAYWLSECAAKASISCLVTDIAKADLQALAPADPDALLIILSPIHGFNFPGITLRFITHFPDGKNKLVLMNTRGGMRIGKFVTPGMTGVAFLLSSFLLIRKGYTIVGQIPFDMPSNWISLHPALHQKTVAFLHEQNYRRVEKHAARIFSGKPDFHSLRDIVQDILIAPVSLGYYLVGRHAFAKSFYASRQCDHCGQCIRQCPVKAIKTLNDRPYWTFRCESCMKCMNSCPKKAIETAHGLFAILPFISSALLTLLLDRLFGITLHSELIRLTAFSFVFISLLLPLYRIQHQFLNDEKMGKWISYTSLTHYKFWGRYKSISDDQWKK